MGVSRRLDTRKRQVLPAAGEPTPSDDGVILSDKAFTFRGGSAPELFPVMSLAFFCLRTFPFFTAQVLPAQVDTEGVTEESS
ncbi:hypothetical protein Anapl_07334 [Anas platyrhynchos]|uniref:Uncharacterized protein n=1 Tax=Anas platyrhynchos TaxID=8839 RepID=R0LCE5_ANAPL|nr:hypothetical protein Anapl_07334 [Anas platyrhynchos]